MRSLVLWLFVCLLGSSCRSSPDTEETNPGLTLEESSSSLEGIRLRWFIFEATFRRPGGGLRSTKPISRLKIERQDVASGTWQVLVDALPGSDRDYLDREVDAGARYRYRVSSYVGDDRCSSVETAAPLKPAPWSVQFREPGMVAGSEAGKVYVVIQKFEKGIGIVETGHLHSEQDRIGWWPERGPDPVSRHPVRLPNGKIVEIDFDTGETLAAVRSTRLHLRIKRCRMFYDSSGTWTGCEEVLEEREFDTTEIRIMNKEEVHNVFIPKLPPKEQFCERHSGRGIVTSLDQVLSPEAVRDSRMLEAQKLLAEADRLWETDSEASIRIYKRLLRNYQDVVIRLQVRNRVEGRSRQSEKE